MENTKITLFEAKEDIHGNEVWYFGPGTYVKVDKYEPWGPVPEHNDAKAFARAVIAGKEALH